jgi:hypothetical protein
MATSNLNLARSIIKNQPLGGADVYLDIFLLVGTNRINRCFVTFKMKKFPSIQIPHLSQSSNLVIMDSGYIHQDKKML